VDKIKAEERSEDAIYNEQAVDLEIWGSLPQHNCSLVKQVKRLDTRIEIIQSRGRHVGGRGTI